MGAESNKLYYFKIFYFISLLQFIVLFNKEMLNKPVQYMCSQMLFFVTVMLLNSNNSVKIMILHRHVIIYFTYVQFMLQCDCLYLF